MLVLVSLCLGAVSAQASPAQVLADFRVDQRLNASYPLSDLRGALDLVQGTPRYRILLAAIDDRISSNLLGVHPSISGTPAVPRPRPVGQKEQPKVAKELPAPPTSIVPVSSPGPLASGLPLMIVALGAMGVVLALGGMASAISRRQTRA